MIQSQLVRSSEIQKQANASRDKIRVVLSSLCRFHLARVGCGCFSPYIMYCACITGGVQGLREVLRLPRRHLSLIMELLFLLPANLGTFSCLELQLQPSSGPPRKLRRRFGTHSTSTHPRSLRYTCFWPPTFFCRFELLLMQQVRGLPFIQSGRMRPDKPFLQALWHRQ